MEHLIGICGLDCAECPAYQATQKDDDEERKRVAEMWSKEYGADIKPEDVNCDGCIVADGRHFSHWDTCEIRKCGFEQGVKNCARCTQYSCEKLDKFFEMAPQAKANLEEIRQSK